MKTMLVTRTDRIGGTMTGRQGGFTLLEVIVTIVIAAIMGVFFAQFVGTSVIHSADPVLRVQNLSRTTHIMEYMTADYKRLAATQSNFLAIFKDYVAMGIRRQNRRATRAFPTMAPTRSSITITSSSYRGRNSRRQIRPIRGFSR